MQEKVDILLSKAKEYIGIPYKPWNPNLSLYGDHGPFWSFNGPEPSFDRVKKELLNCVGFINVLRRHLNLEIPGATEQTYYAGGTYEWFVYLDSRGKLRPYREGKEYPRGTLLIRRFRDQNDDGHVAIVIGKNRVIHSIRSLGVCEGPLWEGYYEYACLPHDWL